MQELKSWNLKHPFINGCFNWMIQNLYIGNGCFTKHPFKTGCLGFQDDETFCWKRIFSTLRDSFQCVHVSFFFLFFGDVPSLKLRVRTCQVAPGTKRKGKFIVFQPSIFRGELLVSWRVNDGNFHEISPHKVVNRKQRLVKR